MDVTWKLRMAAAQREVWTGAQLRRLLAERAGVEMSAASVSALMRQAPKQLKLATLQALCVALDCQPGDLIEIDTTPVAKPVARGGKPAPKRASRGQTRSRTPPPF
ncbi:MAG: helix-turn-helix domain-containing protein [Solirubrobacteraceae bacterium]